MLHQNLGTRDSLQLHEEQVCALGRYVTRLLWRFAVHALGSATKRGSNQLARLFFELLHSVLSIYCYPQNYTRPGHTFAAATCSTRLAATLVKCSRSVTCDFCLVFLVSVAKELSTEKAPHTPDHLPASGTLSPPRFSTRAAVITYTSSALALRWLVQDGILCELICGLGPLLGLMPCCQRILGLTVLLVTV